MVDKAKNKVLIREFNADTDIEVVGKLERNCKLGSERGVSIFTNMMCDPLCRIRFYPLHTMLVAQQLDDGELVGVVRGCIKHVGAGYGETHVMGCILGLRVSPTHRRMGVGFQLMKSVEEWLKSKGAQYTFLATEQNNTASTNLFTSKLNYMNISSLIILVQPISTEKKPLPQDIKIEKLHVDHAILLYKSRLRDKDIHPTDMDVILRENLNLGTWVCYFEEQGWINIDNEENNNGTIAKTQRSWVIFSIWNTCEAHKLPIRKSQPLSYFHATLSHAREKIFSWLKMPQSNISVQNSLGFLFLYGLHGEGEQLAELMGSVWNFALGLGQNVMGSKLILTELGICDPLLKHVPDDPKISRIHDVWYAKRLNSHPDDQDDLLMKGPLGNVFVDPREF